MTRPFLLLFATAVATCLGCTQAPEQAAPPSAPANNPATASQLTLPEVRETQARQAA